MQQDMTRFGWMLPLSLVLACGEPWTPAAGPSGSATPAPSPAPSGASVRAYLLAAEGGALSSADGRARLFVPAGALAADGEVVLTPVDGLAGVVGHAYAVGPESLALTAPVRMEVDLDHEVPWGRRAALAVREGDQWRELSESVATPLTGVSDDDRELRGTAAGVSPVVVSAPPASRSRVMGLMFRAGTVAAVTWEDAPDADVYCGPPEAFDEPCDGSPIGHWTLLGACGALAQANDPFRGQCEAAAFTSRLDWRGDFAIGELAMSAVVAQASTELTVDAPLACVGDDVAACAALSDEDTRCAADAGRCRCTTHTRAPEHASAYPLSIEGDVLVLSDGEGHEVARARYCARADRLLLEVRASGPAAAVVPAVRYVLQRR
jgi:hypothetical protein